jgi:uncharacterized OB-fold protein
MPVGPLVRDNETAAFLDGAARGEFLIRYCPRGHASSPHAQLCDTCASADLTWRAAAGVAKVVSWAVVPGGPHEVVLVVAEFEEGPWWWSHIIDADPDDLAVGMPLTVRFERFSDEHEAVPVFARGPFIPRIPTCA